MSFIEILLISVGLAMDCLAVSIVCGFIFQRLQVLPMLRIAFFFGLFQALMPCIGWFFGQHFYAYICRWDHWIAFGILAFLGGKMIWDDLRSQGEETDINPYRWGAVLAMAVATSIDALAVGLSFSLLDIHLWTSVACIGIVSFVLSLTGMLLAICLGKRLHLKANLLGGLILAALGLKILLEHLIAG